MVYTFPVTVRYAETDQMGVVHHASFLVYLEEARAGLLSAGGVPYKELEAGGVGLPVRGVDVRYLKSGRYGDELDVSVVVLALRPASVRFEQSIRRRCDGSLIVSAQVDQACFDMGSRRPKRFPEPLYEVFRAAMAPEAARGVPEPPSRTPQR